jgi:hypothetical protein
MAGRVSIGADRMRSRVPLRRRDGESGSMAPSRMVESGFVRFPRHPSCLSQY